MDDLFGVSPTGGSAVISACGNYRYRLDRNAMHTGGPTYAFFGVNPSTADATLDDATVRKWTGFVRRWGGRRYIVGNVFAWRATDVKQLAQSPDPIGPDNDAHIAGIIAEADILVPCWGNSGKLPLALRDRLNTVALALMAAGKPVRIFGRTANGDPTHPLMLGYDTLLIDWVRAA